MTTDQAMTSVSFGGVVAWMPHAVAKVCELSPRSTHNTAAFQDIHARLYGSALPTADQHIPTPIPTPVLPDSPDPPPSTHSCNHLSTTHNPAPAAPAPSSTDALAALQRLVDSAPHPAARLAARGIANPGNLCFANATLQALLASPLFCALLDDAAAATSLLKQDAIALNCLAALPAQLSAAATQPLPPSSVMPLVHAFVRGPGDSSGAHPPQQLQQQDAQEFFTFLIDMLHGELLALRPIAPTQQPASCAEGEGEWLTMGRRQRSSTMRGSAVIQGSDSVASAIFGGALQSTVRCEGQRPSETVQPCTVLHLDLAPPSVHSVEDALALLTAREVVHGFRATPSSPPAMATKALSLCRLPHVLVLHVMRFTYDVDGLVKLHKPMRFGPTLVLQPAWMQHTLATQHRQGAPYELIATVSHHGVSPSSGHYTANVRQPNGTWMRFDDGAVSNVTMHDVCDAGAYLLLYQRAEEGRGST